MVWLRGIHFEHRTHHSSVVGIIGFDSEDGLEREIVAPAQYSKPLFTPDGNTIVYSNRREHQMMSVDWDGSNMKTLGKGFASDVWRDPETGLDWVYYREGEGGKSSAIFRRRLDLEGEPEPVWDRTQNGSEQIPWLQLSADGRRYSDAFPWNKCGVADPKTGEWQLLAEGCWPGIAPDNSYRSFVFAGSHQHLQMFDNGGENPRNVKLLQEPGYHPRWSNHVRFFTMTSPKVSKTCELYVGKFDAKWEKAEAFHRVTYNGIADLYGDAWIQPDGEAEPEGTVMVAQESSLSDTASEESAIEGQVWRWDHARAKNEVGDLVCRGDLQGRARFGPQFQLLLDQGAFEADHESAGGVLRGDDFSFEAVVKPSGDDGTIVALGSRFSLKQKSGKWVVQMGDESEAFGEAKPGALKHLVLVYEDGKLTAYVDGKPLGRLKAPLAPSGGGALVFGDSKWGGELESIAFYDRAISLEDISRRYLVAAKVIADRPKAAVSEIQAKLVLATPVPPVQALGAYRRSLVENIYEVEKAISGATITVPRIVVKQWAILDQKPLSPFPSLGSSVRLRVELASAHPELGGEHLSADHIEVESPVYFDLDSYAR